MKKKKLIKIKNLAFFLISLYLPVLTLYLLQHFLSVKPLNTLGKLEEKVKVTLIFQKFRNKNLDEIFSITRFLHLPIIFLITIFAYTYLKNKKIFLLSFTISTAITVFIQIIFPQEPPWMYFGIKKEYSLANIEEKLTLNKYSPFPSFHVLYLYLATILFFKERNKKVCKYLFYLFLFLSLVISFSILYTADHYIEDLIASLIIAVISIKSSKVIERLTNY